jgi:ADP-ribosylglycohydrolase
MPIWHNGFVYRPEEWSQLPPEVSRVLGTTHTIRVLEESALAYNNAIVELLNRRHYPVKNNEFRLSDKALNILRLIADLFL